MLGLMMRRLLDFLLGKEWLIVAGCGCSKLNFFKYYNIEQQLFYYKNKAAALSGIFLLFLNFRDFLIII